MTVDAVRAVLAKRPFRPLVVRMGSGESQQVTHPEQIALLPLIRLVVIGIPGSSHLLDVDSIERITPGNGRGRAKRR